MIKTIVFDLGNVLIDFCWEAYIEKLPYDETTKQAISQAMFLSEEWGEFDRSAVPDEEILGWFIAHAPNYETEIRAAFEELDSTVRLYDTTVPWLRKLKKAGYHLYYLSNFPRKTYDQVKELMAFTQEMDGGIYSFEVQMVKPEPQIYQLLMERYGIDPTAAVFLDDNQTNIDAAKALGFHTILVKSHEQAVRELEELGVCAE